MGIKRFMLALLALTCAHGSMAQRKRFQDSLLFSVQPAPEWSALFTRSSGWFGADGIFSVTRDGVETPGAAEHSETILWFSDTMLGEISGDSLLPGSRMINNSIAVLDTGRNISFHWKESNGKSAAIFVPGTRSTQPGDYYWLGDGFVNPQRQLYIFGFRMRNTPGGGTFGFKEMGNSLIIVPAGSQPPFDIYREIEIPFFRQAGISFGAGIFVNTVEAGARNPDGYVYIYGVRGAGKQLIIARVKPSDIESFSKWTFWNGRRWDRNVARIANVTDHVSNELGMMQLEDGRYALVFQEDGMGKHVALRLAPTPAGPFGKLIRLYDCSEVLAGDKDLFVYNAKVHPVLSAPDELLISFNVNSFDFLNDLREKPRLYRPRFIRVRILRDSSKVGE
ncbi:DUF4185 domain-containing protein [Chitinophaga cymbidii]|nr:DUF4185 domain-containing protein [Chitinophaga cymbidii]